MTGFAEKVVEKFKTLSKENQQQVMDYIDFLEQRDSGYSQENSFQTLDKIQVHRPEGNNVYGIIYLAEVTENLLKTIAQAFKIAEHDIRLKVSNFNQEKSLRGSGINFDFIVEKADETLLFNGSFIGTEAEIYGILSQLFIDLAQKNIQCSFEFYDENHDLSFKIT